jgi:hypothetical protein
MDKYRNFNEYKENVGILNFDIERLKKQNLKNDILDKMQSVLKDHDVISNPLLMKSFSNDAGTMGWKNIEKLSAQLVGTCDNVSVNEECLKGLQKLKEFAFKSNLDLNNKNKVSSFINDVESEKVILRKYNHNFIQNFNQEINVMNSKLELRPINSIKIKLSPLKTSKILPQSSLTNKSQSRASINIFALGVIAALFIFWVFKRNNNNKIKKRLFSFFDIKQTNAVNIRVFGKLSSKLIKNYNREMEMLTDFFKVPNSFYGDLHFKFQSNSSVLKIEATYMGKKPLQYFYEDQSSNASLAIKKLVGSVEEVGGEVVFTTKFNSDSIVEMSSLSILLPN